MAEQDEKVRILLVDDKPETLLALEMILEDLQEDIVKAHSGKEALRCLLKEDFAVILLDVNMPGMDGFETAELIRQRQKSAHTPIIFLTAFSDEIYVEKGYSLGAVDYILAPVVPEILRAKVSAFVDLHRKTRQLSRQTDWLQHRADQLRKLTEASLAITSAPSLEAIRSVVEQWARTLIDAEQSSLVFSLGKENNARQGRHADQILVPLMGRNGQLMGTLHVSNKAARAMTEDDETVIVQLAQIASVAMENVMATRQLASEISERQQAMEQLKRSHAQLRELAARMELVREEERTRIAREIHDELGQTLTALKLDAALAKQQALKPGTGLREKLDSISALVDTTIQTVRNIATELRPVVLDQFGLLPAIEWLTGEFQARTGTKVKLNFFMRQVRLSQERSTAVFRIFQEVLTNIARHASATTINVTVSESGGALLFEVVDNGRGITAEELSDAKSLGLLSMRERAALVGGETLIDGTAGKGTRVRISMPPGEDREAR